MNARTIADLLRKLEEERAELANLRNEASRLTLNGHQESIGVVIGGKSRTLRITETGRNYEERLIRGQEMILLGVKKAYAAMIQGAEDAVRARESAIMTAVKGGAK